MRGYEQSAADKQSAAERAAAVAGELGADGVVITTDAGGNSHTDVMLTCRACEQAGIRTTVVLAEETDPAVDEAHPDGLGARGGLDRLDRERRRARRRVDARARAGRRPSPGRHACGGGGPDPGEELPRCCQPDGTAGPEREDANEGRPLPEPVLRRPRRGGGGRDAADPARRRGRARARAGRGARGRGDRGDARLRRRLLRRARGRGPRGPPRDAGGDRARRPRRGACVRLGPVRLRLRAPRGGGGRARGSLPSQRCTTRTRA